MNYSDVLYTPLDLPPRPDIDMNVLNEWKLKTFPQKFLLSDSESRSYIAISRAKVYPWNLVYARRDFNWQNSFDKLFPDLARYCYEGFGLQEKDIASIILLPTRTDYIGDSKKFWHRDPDLGIRFYIDKASNNNKLMYRQLKPEKSMGSLTAWNMTDEDLDDLFYSEVECKSVTLNDAFYINNLGGIHNAVNYDNKERIAVIVALGQEAGSPLMYPKTIIDNILAPLIVKSAEKYSDYAVLKK